MAKKDELNFENGNNMAASEKLKALQAAMDKIEKSFGKGSIMKMGDESVEQVEVIPTGSIGLNVALGVGGYPRGRIIEIYGPESSGKTTLAIHAIAEAQKAGGLLLAWVSEKLVMRRRHRLNAAHTITTIAMLAAISGVLMVIEIPLFFAPSFYKLDFSELPVLICAFYLGPVSGVVCEFLKVLIKLLLKGTSTAFVGDLANFLVGCSFVLPAAIMYQKTLSKKGAVVSLAVGTAVMTVFGSFFNAWFLIPRFAVMYGMPLEAIVSMGTQINGAITNLSTLVLFAVVPFNLLKGVLVSLLTFFLYKRVEKLFFRKKHTA